MRLPTKLSHTPTTTATLPSFLLSAIAVAMVSRAVALPRTVSTKRITLAGLKKCMPITRSGRFVAAAIASTSRLEVLVASSAAPGQAASSLANTSCFSAMSSNTASITASQSRRSSMRVVPATSARRRSISAWSRRLRSTMPA